LYHVAPGLLEAADLTNGNLTMASGQTAVINVDGGVTINDANVTTPNIFADNGVVHVIDAVILPATSSLENSNTIAVSAYPNPSADYVTLTGIDNASVRFVDVNGSEVLALNYAGQALDIKNFAQGLYFIYVSSEQNQQVFRLMKH
jgi:hypothetical protein